MEVSSFYEGAFYYSKPNFITWSNNNNHNNDKVSTVYKMIICIKA